MAVLKRFVVAEHSMQPTLEPGDGLVTISYGDRPRGPRRAPRAGDLCLVVHPLQPSMWLVKRVAAVGCESSVPDEWSWIVDDDEMLVMSDDPEVTTADSRTFGPVPVSGSYRVLVRVPSRWMRRFAWRWWRPGRTR